MPVITATQVIERPVDEIFATVAHAASFHRWNPTIANARKLCEGGWAWCAPSVVRAAGSFDGHDRPEEPARHQMRAPKVHGITLILVGQFGSDRGPKPCT